MSMCLIYLSAPRAVSALRGAKHASRRHSASHRLWSEPELTLPHYSCGIRFQMWAAIFIPIPLPRKVIRTSYCTHLLSEDVLPTGSGMGMGMNGTARSGSSEGVAKRVSGLHSSLYIYIYIYIYTYIYIYIVRLRVQTSGPERVYVCIYIYIYIYICVFQRPGWPPPSRTPGEYWTAEKNTDPSIQYGMTGGSHFLVSMLCYVMLYYNISK